MIRLTIASLMVAIFAFAGPVVWAFDDDETKSMEFLPGEKRRSTELKFQEGLVEGVGRPDGKFGSVAADWKQQGHGHLYSKEMSFERELKDTIRNVRYAK